MHALRSLPFAVPESQPKPTFWQSFTSLFIARASTNGMTAAPPPPPPDPVAMLAAEQEALRTQIAQLNRGLSAQATVCERLLAQIQRLQSDQRATQDRIDSLVSQGNQPQAAQLALRLQLINQQLDENQRQAKSADAAFRELVAARQAIVQSASSKIDSIKRSLDSLAARQASVDLRSLTEYQPEQQRRSGTGSLAALESMVSEQALRAAARAKLDTISSEPPPSQAALDMEQELSSQAALDEYLAQRVKRSSPPQS